ncbi:HNH endonuclease signature motif containing protein [Amnibacterium kyonggiense]|uniref:Uncharacterized protein DUF222 n=1 Tax=Amnibacterium kyonggiense TaxID=595671 RepID=A0A4R7FL00_9MICO|nr:HNH endonuclease signature motif containing protein [Amnibacterium kyonggiense]TDS77062.1 uncharacterized protein DUF222 [Amnibacterium kyonggiense]
MFGNPAAAVESPNEAALRTDVVARPVMPIGRVDGAVGSVVIEQRHDPVLVTDDDRERFAEEQQDALSQVEADLRRADADRTVALIDAYEASMQDLAGRYGTQYGERGSLGAQSFFQSIGLRLGMSPLRVARLLDTAVRLRDDLPAVWAAYLDGAAPWRAVELAADQAEGLDDEHLAAYDEQAAVAVVAAPASRLKAKLHTIRERLQDDTAGERSERTRAMRRVTIDHGHDGAATIAATGPAIPIVGFDQALTKAAIAARLREGETRSVGQLRFDIMMDLLVEGIKQQADPAWAGLRVPMRKGVIPAPIVTIPALAALGRTTEQARLVGYGPVSIEAAKELAGEAPSFLRVLTDPFTGVRIAMDRTTRKPPADMRRWVTLRDELCRFPGCNRPAHLCDLDHVQEWQDAGVTDIGNLVSLSRPHHLAKSVGLWDEELRENGSVDWRNPWGEVFTDPPSNPSDPAPPELVEPGPADPPGDDCPF